MTLRRVRSTPLAFALAAVLAAGAASIAGCAVVDMRSDANASDVGLPLYPGAVKAPAKTGDQAGVSVGMWGSAFGVKLAAVRYVSADGVETVARFYRDALSKYGPVLDCSNNRAKTNGAGGGTSADIDSDTNAGTKPVSCGNDSDTAGGRLYKVGTQEDQRVFSLRPEAQGVSFQLMHLQFHGAD